MFDHSRLERLARDKRSSLLGSFVNYDENNFLWIQLQGAYSQHYASWGIIYYRKTFIVQATVITIVNYDYNTFIVQATTDHKLQYWLETLLAAFKKLFLGGWTKSFLQDKHKKHIDLAKVIF